MFQYIELFYDKADVVEDLKPYLLLLDSKGDCEDIRNKIDEIITNMEKPEP